MDKNKKATILKHFMLKKFAFVLKLRTFHEGFKPFYVYQYFEVLTLLNFLKLLYKV